MIIQGMGICNFNNVGFEENHLHKLKYTNEKIKLVIDISVTYLYAYSEKHNRFFRDYLHNKPRMYFVDKELELSDLKKMDYTHGDFDSLLCGDMVTVRNNFIHLVDFGENVKDANVSTLSETDSGTTYVSGKIYRELNDCPYKSIKIDSTKTLIVIGKTGRGNTKIKLLSK